MNVLKTSSPLFFLELGVGCSSSISLEMGSSLDWDSLLEDRDLRLFPFFDSFSVNIWNIETKNWEIASDQFGIPLTLWYYNRSIDWKVTNMICLLSTMEKRTPSTFISISKKDQQKALYFTGFTNWINGCLPSLAFFFFFFLDLDSFLGDGWLSSTGLWYRSFAFFDLDFFSFFCFLPTGSTSLLSESAVEDMAAPPADVRDSFAGGGGGGGSTLSCFLFLRGVTSVFFCLSGELSPIDTIPSLTP